MTEMYMVCRFVPAVLPCMAGLELSRERIDAVTFYALAMNKDMRVFADRDKAVEYAKEATARIGGGNWEGYGGSDLEKEPWFLEKVDDGFDETYCDIYAKVDLNAKIKGENDE